MSVYKHLILFASIIAVSSCTERIDPWSSIDPFQGDNNGQNIVAPQDADSTSSGVVVESDDTSEDNVANTSFDATINIVFNGSNVTTSGSAEGVAISKSGAHVTANNTGTLKVKYILSGTSTDGCFKLYSAKKQAIQLSGLSLANADGAAINNQSKKRTFIIVEGTNTLADGNVNSSGDYPEQTSDEDMKAALFSEGQLIFSGTGSLKVTAKGKAGITSDDYIHFMEGPAINVTSALGHGVRGKDAIYISGGNVNVTVESTATGRKCLTTDSLLLVNGGNTTLVNKASAGTVDSEITGAAGIKADQMFVIKDGVLDITASGKGCKGISGDAKGYFEGGKVTVKATGANYGSSSNRYSSSDNSVSSKAIKFDGNLEFTGATVVATCSNHEAIESKGTIYIGSGRISATSSDDAINSSSTMTIAGGIVYACSTGNDGLDANGNLVIKGGTVYAIGCGSPEVAIDANTESGYKLYIYGGNVIAVGGIESGSYVSQPMISTSWKSSTIYSLCDGDNVIFSFKTPTKGGSGLYMTAPSLVSGTSYTLKTSATLSGAESFFDGILSTGGSATGGSSSSLTASTYSSGGGSNPGGGGGGGFGPGGRH